MKKKRREGRGRRVRRTREEWEREERSKQCLQILSSSCDFWRDLRSMCYCRWNTKLNKPRFWVNKEWKKDLDDFLELLSLRIDINYWQGNFTRAGISVQMRIKKKKKNTLMINWTIGFTKLSRKFLNKTFPARFCYLFLPCWREIWRKQHFLKLS